MLEKLGISSVHYVVTEFVGKYGPEQVQSQAGKAEHLSVWRYNGNRRCAKALTRFDQAGKPHSFQKPQPILKPSLRKLLLLQYLKVEAVLLNLLLWPLVQMQGRAGLVGGEAGVWDNEGRGEDGRRGWRPRGAAGGWLCLCCWGSQALLLCNKPATGRKTSHEDPQPDPPSERALGSPAAAGTSLEQGCSNHAALLTGGP